MRHTRALPLLVGCLGAAVALAFVRGAVAKAPPDSAIAPGAGLAVAADVRSQDGRATTTISVRDLHTGAVRSTRVVAGAWVLPKPVPGARPEGVAWNGSTMVLRSRTAPGRFLVAPVGRGPAVRRDIRATGRLEYDALSFDGARLFLSEYTDRSSNVLDRIRVFDLATGTLRRDAVVDKLDGSETMAGVPVARALASDGRTTYTVYESRAHPFVHVLFTEDVLSLCVDLPATGSPKAPGRWTARLDTAHNSLVLTSGRLKKRFVVKLASFSVDVADTAKAQ